MNNKGKSSLGFIFLIPIFLIVTLIIVDTLFTYIENKRFKSNTESIVKEVLTNEELGEDEYYTEIKKLYEKKGYETDVLIVEGNSSGLYLENSHTYFGLFSSLSKKEGIESQFEILGVPFKIKKNSVTRIMVDITMNDEEIEFEYTE